MQYLLGFLGPDVQASRALPICRLLRIEQINLHVSPLLYQGIPIGNGLHECEGIAVVSGINESHDLIEPSTPCIEREAAERVELVLSELDTPVLTNLSIKQWDRCGMEATHEKARIQFSVHIPHIFRNILGE